MLMRRRFGVLGEFDSGQRAGGAVQQRIQQRSAEGEQRHDGALRIARQAQQPAGAGAGLPEVGQCHRMARSNRHRVDHETAPQTGDCCVEMVDRPGRGAAGGDDHVGAAPGGGDRGDMRVQRVGGLGQRHDVSAEALHPTGQLRAERIAHLAGPCHSLLDQFVAEQHDGNGRQAPHSHLVETGGGEHAGVGRRDRGARGGEHITHEALLAAGADVLAARGLCNEAVLADLAVLPPAHGRGTARDGGTGRDDAGVSGLQCQGRRLPRQNAADDLPGALTRNRPAIHGRGVEGGQVGAGHRVSSQHTTVGVDEGHRFRCQRPAAARCFPGGIPVGVVQRHTITGPRPSRMPTRGSWPPLHPAAYRIRRQSRSGTS